MMIGSVIIRSSTSWLSSINSLDQLAALQKLKLYPTLCTSSLRHGYALVCLPPLIHNSPPFIHSYRGRPSADLFWR
jgi:hypothetical protein